MKNEDVKALKLKAIKDHSIVHQRHLILNENYLHNTKSAWITDSAEVIGINLQDPFRTTVFINEHMKTPFVVGVHKAVGGDHDYPNPGDLLCASLASCFDSTIRLISNKLGIRLIETKIRVNAQIDVRGTLMIDQSIPVEFQNMHIEALIIAKDTSKKLLDILINGAKRSCIIYQTIKKGTPITLNTELKIRG